MLKSGSDMVSSPVDPPRTESPALIGRTPDGCLGQGPRVRLGALYRHRPGGRNLNIRAQALGPERSLGGLERPLLPGDVVDEQPGAIDKRRRRGFGVIGKLLAR